MEVKKPVGSHGKRRQLVLKILMPISSDSDVASREEDSISWRYNRPAVQAVVASQNDSKIHPQNCAENN